MPFDPRRVPDEIRRCLGCGFSTMAKASEPGWKGMDLAVGDPLSWYCPKVACQGKADEAVTEWQVLHGYVAKTEDPE